VWLLVTDPMNCVEEERPIRRVEFVWSTWKELTVTPLTAVESTMGGTCREELEDVPGLEHVIQTIS
jgi:phosphomevalonate kinase